MKTPLTIFFPCFPCMIFAVHVQNDKNEEIKAQPKLEGSSTNQKIGRKEENLSVNSSSSKTQHGQPTLGPYPDVIDISEMDYSMAPRRKPPIHN